MPRVITHRTVPCRRLFRHVCMYVMVVYVHNAMLDAACRAAEVHNCTRQCSYT